jgi:hypothetical protein
MIRTTQIADGWNINDMPWWKTLSLQLQEKYDPAIVHWAVFDEYIDVDSLWPLSDEKRFKVAEPHVGFYQIGIQSGHNITDQKFETSIVDLFKNYEMEVKILGTKYLEGKSSKELGVSVSKIVLVKLLFVELATNNPLKH